MIPYFEFTKINLGPLTLNVWGLFVALGFATAIWLSVREAKRRQLPDDKILDLSFWIILGAIIGTRIFFVLGEWSYFKSDPWAILRIWEGGQSFYGGLIGGSLVAWFFIKKWRLPFWQVADIIFYALPLGYAIGRIGCFLIHDHLGRLTHFFLGIQYQGQVRHETALYSLAAGLAIFWLIALVKNRAWWRTRPGSIAALFLVSYGFTRFLIDFLRAADLPGADPRFGVLTGSQYLSVLLLFMGVVLFLKVRRHSIA